MHRWVPYVLLAVALCGCPQGPGDPGAPDPVIDTIETRSGPAAGGTVVAIVGENLTPRPFITLGPNNVEDILLATAERVEFVTPEAEVGPGHLTLVREDGGRATVLDAFFYLPDDPVWYQAQWFDGADSAGEANPVTLELAGEVTAIDLELLTGEGGSVSGSVTDPSGNPAPEVAVWAQRLDGLVFPVATISDLDGAFTLRNLPPGDWRVYTESSPSSSSADVLHPGVVSPSDADTVTVTSAEDTGGISLPLIDGGTLTGSVVGADGPIASTSVFASMAGNSFSFGSSVTEDDGTYSIHGLAPGDYTALAFGYAADHATEYYDDAYVAADATPVSVTTAGEQQVDFDLLPGAFISGSVLEETTLEPLGGLQVIAEELGTGAVLTGGTDAQGDYAVGPLPAGDWRVSVTDIGQYYNGVDFSDPPSATVLSLSAGETATDVNFVGRMGWQPACPDATTTAVLTGVVETDQGVPLSKTKVEIVDDDTGVVFARSATVATDGTWTIDCVPPATYRVRATAAGTTFMRQWYDGVLDEGSVTTVTVSAMETASAIDFSLSQGGKLSGRVTDALTHAPLPGVVITVEHVPTGATGSASAGVDGTWTVTRLSTGGLPPGDYVIFARDHLTTPFTPSIYY